MLAIITILSLLCAACLLIALCIIDLKIRLLPNELVMGFLACGLVFHLSTLFAFIGVKDMALGAFIGSASLYLIRGIANKLYGQDALGLGDVKLMGAAGAWLGPYYILIAMTLGAVAGIIHGLSLAFYYWHKSKSFPHLATLSLPAGPGFAVGIVLTGIWIFRHLPYTLVP